MLNYCAKLLVPVLLIGCSSPTFVSTFNSQGIALEKNGRYNLNEIKQICVDSEKQKHIAYEGIYFIANNSYRDIEGRYKYEINGESIIVEDIKAENGVNKNIYLMIKSYYSKKLIREDIRLKFALVNRNVTLYWEETYENQSRLFGLILLEKDILTPYCIGSVGFDAFH